MPNLPGPYILEYQLTGFVSPVRSHLMRFNCIALSSPAAGTPATTIDMQKQGGATAKLNVVANQLWEFLRPFWATAIACTSYTLWKAVPGTYGRDFVIAAALTNPACNGSTGTASAELVQTYRSANGGIMKIVLLETDNTGDTQTALVANAAGNDSQKLAAYVMSADNIIIARDDAFIVAPLRDSRGQNERIWRRINRGT